MVALFEGMNIYFPKRIGLNELHEQIYAELRQGANYRDMSVKYGYTKSYIRKIERKKYNEKKKEGFKNINAESGANKSRDNKPAKIIPRDTKRFEQGELFYEGTENENIYFGKYNRR